MIRADSLNSHVDPVITEITVTQQIPILHVCDSDERKLKEILAEKTLSQVCSTSKSESKIVIVGESSTEESESESFYKASTQTKKIFNC